MKDLISTAIQLRKPIISSDTNAFQLFDGEGDGVEDVIILQDLAVGGELDPSANECAMFDKDSTGWLGAGSRFWIL